MPGVAAPHPRRDRSATGGPATGGPATGGLAWATLSSPVGPLAVGCTAAGVAQVRFRASTRDQARAGRPGRPGGRGQQPGGDLLATARDQLAEYFSGQRTVFDMPIDWAGASPAQRQVLDTLFRSVGYGETVTYGELAQRAVAGPDGISLPARAIGGIMGSNPIPVIVPCHRVVAGNGLGGYSGGTGIEVKRWLLIFEGALPATLDWTAAGI
ncbi:MAG TPA: methylated-DNA--[protein]-cysteine S-methyltransferase [Streptosporangiaceae bacterium]|nr:methylated-DNA--[protein]-cysteine S-methyltransferase [Streptosporangiaceae bacterium]